MRSAATSRWHALAVRSPLGAEGVLAAGAMPALVLLASGAVALIVHAVAVTVSAFFAGPALLWIKQLSLVVGVERRRRSRPSRRPTRSRRPR